MKVREVLKRLEDDGWVLVRTRGSHRQFQQASHETFRGHRFGPPIGGYPTLKNIWRMAEIEDPR